MSSALNDMLLQGLQRLGSMAFNRGAVVVGATTTAITSTVAINYAIRGAFPAPRAAFTNQALVAPTGETFYVQPASTTVYYTVAVNAAGDVRTFQGSFVGQDLTARGGGVAKGDGRVRDVDLDWAPIALIRIATNGSTTFTPGTTALNAAGLTVTITDVCLLPLSMTP
ncbi:hypothetical protein UFOVP707_39 [uncultured Caudovirales phage]|uniref:Uncharacterized protein n=1 Tax=uncultured Caudovirales phage TaxID=2100421 RepID=A0A6J5NJH9_9CAUD|nr:hypothetical protein UFOVP707_39 [uncultured Caudovirales phage]